VHSAVLPAATPDRATDFLGLGRFWEVLSLMRGNLLIGEILLAWQTTAACSNACHSQGAFPQLSNVSASGNRGHGSTDRICTNNRIDATSEVHVAGLPALLQC
jgi:hypothetical protein